MDQIANGIVATEQSNANDQQGIAPQPMHALGFERALIDQPISVNDGMVDQIPATHGGIDRIKNTQGYDGQDHPENMDQTIIHHGSIKERRVRSIFDMALRRQCRSFIQRNTSDQPIYPTRQNREEPPFQSLDEPINRFPIIGHGPTIEFAITDGLFHIQMHTPSIRQSQTDDR